MYASCRKYVFEVLEQAYCQVRALAYSVKFCGKSVGFQNLNSVWVVSNLGVWWYLPFCISTDQTIKCLINTNMYLGLSYNLIIFFIADPYLSITLQRVSNCAWA